MKGATYRIVTIKKMKLIENLKRRISTKDVSYLKIRDKKQKCKIGKVLMWATPNNIQIENSKQNKTRQNLTKVKSYQKPPILRLYQAVVVSVRG
jgi:hypothetical protein